MTEINHSPLPWKSSTLGSGEFQEHVILDANCGLVATCLRNWPGSKANADLIGQACNAHDALLEACKELTEVLGRLPIGDPLISDAYTACKKARAAIAKVTPISLPKR